MSEMDLGALFQIEEPTETKTRPRRPGFGIGIDLGTTHSLVCLAPNGDAPRAVPDGEGRTLVPSVVSYVGDDVVVGSRARALQVEHPSQVVSSAKRFMGRGAKDIEFEHPYRVVTEEQSSVLRFDVGTPKPVTPMQISAEVLRELKQRAEAELGAEVDGAVITVPAYFDDAQRQATRDAGRIAGLQVYRLLAEPTAAALAYGLDKGGQGVFAVFDLGGGTFDISILRLRDGVFQVLATGGDSALGGDDFDRAVAEHLLHEAGVDAPTDQQREEALFEARRAKEALTDAESVTVALSTVGRSELQLGRAKLNEIIDPIARRTVPACRRALKDAGVRAKELDGVVLVGGSTRVPLVRSLVESTFQAQTPLGGHRSRPGGGATGRRCRRISSRGAEREGVTLLDVVPLSLGLETMGGIVERTHPAQCHDPDRRPGRCSPTTRRSRPAWSDARACKGERELADGQPEPGSLRARGDPPVFRPAMARVEVTLPARCGRLADRDRA